MVRERSEMSLGPGVVVLCGLINKEVVVYGGFGLDGQCPWTRELGLASLGGSESKSGVGDRVVPGVSLI